MSTKKISQLVSGSLNTLPLSGITTVVHSNETYQYTLDQLRTKLVDSGSHVFSGDQIIDGMLTISGSMMVEGESVVNGMQHVMENLVVGPDFMVNSGSMNTEMLHVGSTGTINIAHFTGRSDYYAQINVFNFSSGSLSSSDIVATADNGNESVHFVDLGINSSTYNGGFVGGPNDAYLLNVGKDLYIGTIGGTSHPSKVHLFSNNRWENPQITIHTGSQVTFNTSSITEGYTYEFSGSVKLQNELKVDGSITASYFVGDGSQLTNLPSGGGNIDSSSLATTGSNIFFGDQTITGSINFGDGSVIQSISSSSADGNGYSTLTLKPDVSLGTDQYIVLDPTVPNHIHIRPGGTVDNSGAELYIGGEKNYLRINDGAPSVRMQTENGVFINSYYFTSGSGVSSIEWTSDQFGNNFVKFNDPTIDVYNAIWAFNYPSTFTATYNGGNDYISFTVNGSSTPGLPQAASFYVLQAPPSSPTYLDYADIQILQNRQTYIEVNGSDVRIEAADDVRIFSQDAFRLINYSATQPIEIITNYDDVDKTFAFNVDGTLTFPDGTTQNSAFTTSSFNEFATTGSNIFSDTQTINGYTILSNVTSSFSNDAEAEAAGVPLQGLYRSGSFVMIRLT